MSSPSCLLELSKVNFSTKERFILKNVSAQFFPNRIYAVIGVNGSGKTSLASVIMGLGTYAKITGEVKFMGRVINDLGISERSKLGIKLAWQEPARFEGLTIARYLDVSISNKVGSVDYKKYVEGALRMVGLAPRKYMKRFVNKTLSGGERKRIELASLILSKPRFALLDEPDSGIDLDSIDHIISAIKRLKNKDCCVVIITHNKKMLDIADEVFVMKKGVLKKGKRIS